MNGVGGPEKRTGISETLGVNMPVKALSRKDIYTNRGTLYEIDRKNILFKNGGQTSRTWK